MGGDGRGRKVKTLIKNGRKKEQGSIKREEIHLNRDKREAKRVGNERRD